MLNRKYYPFERNSYYFGKLLTAKDFESEQKYFNDKRRFINRLNGANGIVAGLGVIHADDASIVIQAGCAFDASGREIVVPETKVVKLSTIEGYTELTTSTAYLGISYREQPTDKVYAVMSQQAGAEDVHNKVFEDYTLTLIDESLAEKVEEPIDAYIKRHVLFSDGDIEVVQYIPKYIPVSDYMIVKAEIRKIGSGSGEYSFCYNLLAPAFESETGEKNIQIGGNNIKLSYGDVQTFSYTLIPERHIWGANGTVGLTAENLNIQKNGEVFPLNETFEMLVKPVNSSVEEFYLSEYYNTPMDKTLEEKYDQRLWIAKLSLIRQKTQIILDSVAPPPFDQYAYNSQQLMLLRRLEAYYPTNGMAQKSGEANVANFAESRVATQSSAERRATSGVFDLTIGLDHDQRQAIFSHEIMHGLGKGPVFVQVAPEFINTGEPGRESSEIILGETDIFDGENTSTEKVHNMRTAVKVLPQRGTFVVGAKLGEATGLISVRIRWFAFRADEINENFKPTNDNKPYILVNPDTIVLKPKDTAHISPIFVNMPTEACNYRVIDPQGGTIDQNGVYTAPAKEGVYEICIEAVSNPLIFTHAFIIVSQKKKDEE